MGMRRAARLDLHFSRVCVMFGRVVGVGCSGILVGVWGGLDDQESREG